MALLLLAPSVLARPQDTAAEQPAKAAAGDAGEARPEAAAQSAPEPAAGEARATPARAAGQRAPGKATVKRPQDHVWQVDEEGRRYFIDRIAKGRFTRVDEHTVRPWNGPELEASSTRTTTSSTSRSSSRRRSKPWKPGLEVTDEDLARYEGDEVPQVDVLRLLPFGDGLPARGQWRNGFALADMNGDGYLDIVHGPARKAFTPAGDLPR